MRRDGDLLLLHLGRASREVVLCAPFIKEAVVRALLDRVAPAVGVTVATRWRPEEIAAGVSDLDVYDLVSKRPGGRVKLLDNLHAKLYVADDACLVGSANLTATALGWSQFPNLELLIDVDPRHEAIADLLTCIATAADVSADERDAMAARVASLPQQVDMAVSVPLKGTDSSESDWESSYVRSGPWLPTCAAPGSLFTVYRGTAGDRLTRAVTDAGRQDLDALGIPPGLDQTQFEATVAAALARMPAVRLFLDAAARDLRDDEAVRLIQELRPAGDLPPEARWRVLWEWLTRFYSTELELAPTNFVLRRKPSSRAR